MDGCARIYLLTWIVLQQKIVFSSYVDVIVSQARGQDTAKCHESNSTLPCKSIEYALERLQTTSDGTTLRIFVMDEIYWINNSVIIRQPNPDINLLITSRYDITWMECNRTDAGIDIGLRTLNLSAYNVEFSNIAFKNCGPVRAAVVLIWNARNVSFNHCEFVDNTQAAINAFDSTLTVHSSSFIRNSYNERAGQPWPVFEPGIVSMSGAIGYLLRNAYGLSLTITESYFYNNTAVVHDDDFYVSAAMNYTQYSEDGGAILVILTGGTANCSVRLDRLNITENSATYGAGVFIATGGYSRDNEFIFTNAALHRNWASQAGGGLCIAQWDYSFQSRFIFRNITIIENFSRRGAGVNAFFMSFFGDTDNVLEFTRLHVEGNFAKSSPAFRLTSSLPYGNPPDLVPVFTNCTITKHVTNAREGCTYLAPITAQRMSLTFVGRNVISHNHGAGGMDIEYGLLHVIGELVIEHNTCQNAGALKLWGSQVVLHPGSHLAFYQNFGGLGGAISSETFPINEVIHEYNADCLLTYSESLVPPSKWETNVTFVGNGAMLKGAAIYVSSLSSCLWDEEWPHYNISKSLRWNDKFYYRDNYLTGRNMEKRLIGPEYDIATDTATLRGKSVDKSQRLSPGENMKMQLQGLDELGHPVYTIVTLSETTTPDLQFPGKLSIQNPLRILSPISNDTVRFSYSVSKRRYSFLHNFTHHISITGVYSTHNLDYSLQVEAIPCWPGHKFQDDQCVCDSSIAGVVRCDDNGRAVYLDEGVWGGVFHDRLVTYICPYQYCYCNKSSKEQVGCRFDPDNVDSQCAQGRTGLLCGRCKDDLTVGLRPGECIQCRHSGWILVVVFITVVVLCIVVIWLNPGMSKDLRGPLFFFQMLPFIFIPNESVGSVVTVVSYLLEFGGPLVYVWKTCIAEGIDNLFSVAMGYMMPCTTLLIFLVAYILSRRRIIRMKVRKHSSLQAFWVLMLFMYKYIIETTMRLLHCPLVDNKMVFFYDGNVQCFQGRHLIVSIVALLVLTFLVIPLPIVIVLLTRGYWKVDPQYFSTLTEGLQSHCLWWWAVDLGRRILIVGVYVFVPRWNVKQLWMTMSSLLILTVHSNVQPYTSVRTNVTESLYLLALCVLNIAQFIPDEDTKSSVSATILCIATIHSSIVILYKAYHFFRKRTSITCSPCCHSKLRYGSVDEPDKVDKDQRSMHDAEIKDRQALFDSVFASIDNE
ncbi:uncharacterized protein LOC116603702 [Nematostella vectensis]|uniref:uncharacterized protein LOC116603702 n=1 Tax=Nematostella vectensis TaxID=45351 RepID=UPI00138FFFDA|nr:uncharacterized protein LOC116603702 [Nematostella vectensis]